MAGATIITLLPHFTFDSIRLSRQSRSRSASPISPGSFLKSGFGLVGPVITALFDNLVPICSGRDALVGSVELLLAALFELVGQRILLRACGGRATEGFQARE